MDLAAGTHRTPISLNRYLYANADPANLVDPLGLEGEEEGLLMEGGTAALQAPRIVALGAGGASTTVQGLLVYTVGYIVACEFYIAESGFENTIAIDPPFPFQFCTKARGKGERGRTGAAGNPDPCKGLRPHPSKPGWVIYFDQNGKKKEKPKPPGC